MRTLIISRAGVFQNGDRALSLSQALADRDALVWLDISDPVEEDIQLLHNEFRFHPLAIEDATRAHERPKVDAYRGSTHEALQSPGDYGLLDGDQVVSESTHVNLARPQRPDGAVPAILAGAQADELPAYYFVIFYAATFRADHDRVETNALNLFIGAHYLVTVHTGAIPQVEQVIARWQTPESPLEHKVSVLVYALLDALVDDYFPLMDQVADRVEALEDSIFEAFDERSIQSIFGLKKDLLGLRRVVAPERDVLNVLLRRQLPIFKLEEMAYLQDVYDHIVRVTDNIDTYRDLLSSALDSYLSLQSNNLNQIMKLLTMASIVLMTSALIAGIYGMNFVSMPGLHWRYGFLGAILLMVASTAVLILYFKRQRWLQ